MFQLAAAAGANFNRERDDAATTASGGPGDGRDRLRPGGPPPSYNAYSWYEHGTGRYTRPDPLGLAEDDWTLYAYGTQNPLVNIDPEGLLVLGPGQKCKAFDRAKAKLQQLTSNCDCLDYFETHLGADLPDLINGPLPQVETTGPGGPDGHTPCGGSTTIEVNKKFCRLGGRRALPNILLHELAHYADCDQQRFPPGGGVEEGADAERACLGFSLDAKTP